MTIRVPEGGADSGDTAWRITLSSSMNSTRSGGPRWQARRRVLERVSLKNRCPRIRQCTGRSTQIAKPHGLEGHLSQVVHCKPFGQIARAIRSG
jgi:hypothetical protein